MGWGDGGPLAFNIEGTELFFSACEIVTRSDRMHQQARQSGREMSKACEQSERLEAKEKKNGGGTHHITQR